MSDEIKEILFDMDLIVNHNKVPIYFTQNKVKLLLDYITNLQEELEITNEKWQKDKQFYNSRLEENVKLRVEKEKLKERKK